MDHQRHHLTGVVRVSDGRVVAVVRLHDEDIVLAQGVADLADPFVRHPQAVCVGRDILPVAAQVRFLHVGADERSLLLLYDLQGALQHAGRVHHGDAGAVIVRDHVGHLAQQEHRQAALAQNRGDLHLRVNAVAMWMQW